MKTFLLGILGAMIISSTAMAATNIGTGKDNGGDLSSGQDTTYGVQELQERVERLLMLLNPTEYSQFGAFLLWFDGSKYSFFADAPPNLVGHGRELRSDFFEVSKKVKIMYVGSDLCVPASGGVCRPADAINDPKARTITINIPRSRLLSDANLLQLILHEHLSIFGYEGSFDYTVSSYLIKRSYWWIPYFSLNVVPNYVVGSGSWRSDWPEFVIYSQVIDKTGRCKKSYTKDKLPRFERHFPTIEKVDIPMEVYCVNEQVYIQGETPDMISQRTPFGARGETPSLRYDETPFQPFTIPDFNQPVNYFAFPKGIPHFYAKHVTGDTGQFLFNYHGPEKVIRRLFRKDKIEEYTGPIKFHFFLGENGPRLFTIDKSTKSYVVLIYPNQQTDCSVDNTDSKLICPLSYKDLTWPKE